MLRIQKWAGEDSNVKAAQDILVALAKVCPPIIAAQPRRDLRATPAQPYAVTRCHWHAAFALGNLPSRHNRYPLRAL